LLPSKNSLIQPLALLLAADAFALFGPWPSLRYLAALSLLAFLPGFIWLQALFEQPPEPEERLTLSIGLSLALTILGVMLAVYWPGPLQKSHLLVVSNLLSVTGLALKAWRRKRSASLLTPTLKPLAWATVLALFLGAALLRLPRLGYAEFHEDEAEALMLGVRLLQGEDYALFLHRKGPAQMLLPIAFWLMSDRITETFARFPFTLSSLLSVLTLFFIGRRWFGWRAGLVAGILWALNGYAIAFGRMVQYQALIFFLGPLAIYCFYLAWSSRQLRYQFLGVLLLSTSLLAHFDALLLLPPVLYLGWLILRGEPAGREGYAEEKTALLSLPWQRRLSVAVVALSLFLGLLAAFYLPYMLDPEFQNTAAYLSETRVEPGLLYNNLKLLQDFDQDYSSRFYLPVLAFGLLSFGLWSTGLLKSTVAVTPQTAETQPTFLPKRWLQAVVVLLLLLVVSTVWVPQLWQTGELSLALLPWLGLGLIWFWQGPTVEARVAWLMFGSPLFGYVFLVNDPRTHLYILYPGAALLAGAGWLKWMEWWQDGQKPARTPLRLPLSLLLSLGALLVGVITIYEYQIFLQTESTFSRLRQAWEGSAWELVYDELPRPRDYFGYPKQEGWKAIGALRTQGKLAGDFRSVNEDFIVPIWYNYGQPRSCYETPAYFFVRTAGLDEGLPNLQAYRQVGEVIREGEPRLQIYSASQTSPQNLERYTLEEQIGVFDAAATLQHFTTQNEPAQPVETQFGPHILFKGYDLLTPAVAPGETLYLNLYWQALANPGQDYRAFVHLTDGTTLWGQQDDTPACRLPTSIWRANQHGMGQFRLPVKPNTPPGRYPLIIGLYQAETLERLKITEGAGQIGDDFLWLGDIEVKD
jgi:hypothetical protein